MHIQKDEGKMRIGVLFSTYILNYVTYNDVIYTIEKLRYAALIQYVIAMS